MEGLEVVTRQVHPYDRQLNQVNSMLATDELNCTYVFKHAPTTRARVHLARVDDLSGLADSLSPCHGGRMLCRSGRIYSRDGQINVLGGERI